MRGTLAHLGLVVGDACACRSEGMVEQVFPCVVLNHYLLNIVVVHYGTLSLIK
jgi:hypothetical protein